MHMARVLFAGNVVAALALTSALAGPTIVATAGTAHRDKADGPPPVGYQVIHRFPGGARGVGPGPLMLASDGNFYGVTLYGGSTQCGSPGCGTIFRLAPDGTVTTVHTFLLAEGDQPATAMVQDAQGNLYGTLRDGPNQDYHGAVYRFNPATGDYATIHDFASDGIYGGTTGLLLASDGFLYGMVTGGPGTVYRMALDGTTTTIFKFDPNSSQYDGNSPTGTLMQDRSGHLLGATLFGGDGRCFGHAPSCGTIFEITTAGVLVADYSMFTTAGESPDGGLVQARDGEIWGAASAGGQLEPNCHGLGGCGTLFKFDASSREVVWRFGPVDQGTDPGGLIQGPDGSMFGTTAFGGIPTDGGGYGVVFRVTQDGEYRVLHKFAGGRDGELPGGLTVGPDGALYGTTFGGGMPSNYGTVYRISLP
jgi:uncharacterized repeat protein (TIGR03803 family)